MGSLSKFSCVRQFIVIFVIVKHNLKICCKFLIVYALVLWQNNTRGEDTNTSKQWQLGITIYISTTQPQIVESSIINNILNCANIAKLVYCVHNAILYGIIVLRFLIQGYIKNCHLKNACFLHFAGLSRSVIRQFVYICEMHTK